MASTDEESLSPKNRLKLLCSYGGKILPRPSDGQLKYVGGETRVLAVPRSISFSELKKRIREMFNHAKVVIKYRIMPEDLDALVSVTCDEDLRHMLDEYDRHEPRSPSNSPRFRLFLFSTAPPPPASHSDAAASASSSPIEKRYVEAVNGVPPSALSLFNISCSAATSPTSTSDLRDAFRPARSNLRFTAAAGGGSGLHRVRSTPNLGTASLSQMANGVGPQPYGGHQQDHHHYHRHHYHDGQQVPPPAHGGSGGPWRMGSGPVRYEACACGCGCRTMVAPQPHVRGHHYPHAVGPAVGSGGCVCFGHVEEPAPVPPRSCPQHSWPFGIPRRKPLWE